MSAGKPTFIDTNICLYLLSADPDKADRSERIVAAGGVISVQVLNEFVSIARTKLTLDWAQTNQVLDALSANLSVVALTPSMQRRAVAIAERYALNIYDAAILAAAIESGCSVVATEDLQHCQVIEGVRINNPYR